MIDQALTCQQTSLFCGEILITVTDISLNFKTVDIQHKYLNTCDTLHKFHDQFYSKSNNCVNRVSSLSQILGPILRKHDTNSSRKWMRCQDTRSCVYVMCNELYPHTIYRNNKDSQASTTMNGARWSLLWTIHCPIIELFAIAMIRVQYYVLS